MHATAGGRRWVVLASHLKSGSRRGQVVLPASWYVHSLPVRNSSCKSGSFSSYFLTVKLKLTAKLLKSYPKFFNLGTNAYGAEDVAGMQNREDLIHALYSIDGRHKRSHPQHGLLTGLWQKYFKG